MKFLLHGNAPWVTTGYGVQIGMLADRLKADGHEVAISATYGWNGSTTEWHGMTVYPAGYYVNSTDLIHGHALHFFEGDVNAGWIITCIDVWSVNNAMLPEFQVAAWVPVDHWPVPGSVMEFFHRTNAIPVAMAEFGANELRAWGLDPVHIPLAVDTAAFKPTATVNVGDRSASCREVFRSEEFPNGIPEDAFVVGMVAMNKTWSRDRKGFNEAFQAFGAFWHDHNDAVLLVHSERFGQAEGIHLDSLADACGIPPHAIMFTDQYAYKLGFRGELMPGLYSAMDVLLAPSHGEGFCVPLIEAQACGTPVIASNFTAQPELVCEAQHLRWTVEEGMTVSPFTERTTGWTVGGQREWDPTCRAWFVTPYIASVKAALELAYKADRKAMAGPCRHWARRWDADVLFDKCWRPFIASLEPPAPVVKEPIPAEPDAVAVIVPVLNRPQNVAALVESFFVSGDGDGANLYFVADPDDLAEVVAIEKAGPVARLLLFPGKTPGTYAEKANFAFAQTSEPWLLVVGDDVEFHAGWLDAARAVSATADVVGTNDTAGKVKNPEVAEGRHADHFLVRRTYVEEDGSSLEGPGVFMPDVYRHWYVDKEIVELAKARGRFAPCLAAVVEHHHPGYNGREDLRQADPTYMRAVESSDEDRRMWLSRLPLIEQHRVTRGR